MRPVPGVRARFEQFAASLHEPLVDAGLGPRRLPAPAGLCFRRLGRRLRRLGSTRLDRDVQAHERLEAARLDLLGQPSAAEKLASFGARSRGMQRAGDLVHRRFRGAVAAFLQHIPRRRSKAFERIPFVATRGREVFISIHSEHHSGLRLLEPLARADQALNVELAGVRQLIDGPGDERRLAQPFDELGGFAVAVFAQAGGQLVARRSELFERKGVEPADLRLVQAQEAAFLQIRP